MHATAPGTRRFAEEADLAEQGYGTLGSTGLLASRLGFGTYRVDDRVEEHRQALLSALLSGVNLIDTATNYGGGRGEVLVGQVLDTLFTGGKLSRDGVVVVSKVGFAQGPSLAELQRLEAEGQAREATSKLGPDVWHVLDPRFLEAELEGSLQRMGLDGLDACLLHNPETFLSQGIAGGGSPQALRAEMDDRVREAFVTLERACTAGRLSFYGVSSNGFSLPSSDPASLSVDRILELAKEAGGEHHRMAFLELPLNLLEQGGREPALRASRAGLAVLANRPLNAFAGDRMVRLTPPAPPPSAPPLADAADEVEAIEAIFAQDFAPRIKVEGPGPKPEDLFHWGADLATAPARVAGLDHWQAIEAQVILPQVNAVLPRLGQAFGNDPAFEAWSNRYVKALQELLLSVAAELTVRARKQTAELSARMDPLLPDSWRRATLSRKALAAMLSVPGVSSVLVGMRRRAWVEDALGSVVLPALDPATQARVREAVSS